MPNGVIGNTTDSGSVKSRFEPWLGNSPNAAAKKCCGVFVFSSLFIIFALESQ